MFSKQINRFLFIIIITGSLIFIAAGCDSSSGISSNAHHSPQFDPKPPTGNVGTTPTPAPTPMPHQSDFYPAPHSPMPQMISTGKTVLAHPQFKAISFPSTPEVASIEKFISVFGPSHEWVAMTSEYGIGPATAESPVHLAEDAPLQMSDTQIRNWLTEQFSDPSLPLGTPESQTIYMIYYPEKTHITADNMKSCVDFDGYHNALIDPTSGIQIIYAVIPHCQNFTIDEITEVSTHELVEAAEDPDVNTGYNSLPSDFSIWDTLSYGAEGGDLCQTYSASRYKPSDLGFLIQRAWSNQAAAEGKDPCVPIADGEVYFNASPVVSDTVNYNTNGQKMTSKGIQIPVGQTKTVEVDLYSTGPTNAWSLSFFEPDNSNTLSVQFSQSSGINGDKIQMTITVNSQNQKYSAEPFWIVSTLNGVSHYWPVLVGN